VTFEQVKTTFHTHEPVSVKVTRSPYHGNDAVCFYSEELDQDFECIYLDEGEEEGDVLTPSDVVKHKDTLTVEYRTQSGSHTVATAQFKIQIVKYAANLTALDGPDINYKQPIRFQWATVVE